MTRCIVASVNAANQNVIWPVSDTGIATIDENGLLTAKAADMITVTAKTADGGFVSTVIVRVTP